MNSTSSSSAVLPMLRRSERIKAALLGKRKAPEPVVSVSPPEKEEKKEESTGPTCPITGELLVAGDTVLTCVGSAYSSAGIRSYFDWCAANGDVKVRDPVTRLWLADQLVIGVDNMADLEKLQATARAATAALDPRQNLWNVAEREVAELERVIASQEAICKEDEKHVEAWFNYRAYKSLEFESAYRAEDAITYRFIPNSRPESNPDMQRPPGTGHSYQFLNFDDMAFSGRNFHYERFEGSTFRRVTFVSCVFDSTSFALCDLTGVVFVDCRFKGTTHFAGCERHGSFARFIDCVFESVEHPNVTSDVIAADLGQGFTSLQWRHCFLKERMFIGHSVHVYGDNHPQPDAGGPVPALLVP